MTAAEEGRTVKVRATFTDDGGTEETLESAATEAITALPQVSIIGVTASPVTEGTAASFTFSRTGGTTAALTVAVNVSEDGSMVDGTAPSTVTFAADSATATLTVATADDEVAESASVITATVSFGTGGSIGSVMVEDDDAAPTFAVAGPLEVDENTTTIATLTASDADTAASDLSWSLAGGADEDKVTLSAAGVLAFKAAKDFEAPDDADADGDYEVNDDGDSELARRRFEMKVGYGLPAFGDGFTSAPEIGIGFSGERRDYSLGWRLTREARFGGSLDLSLEARREESANDDAAPVHDIAVRVTARW